MSSSPNRPTMDLKSDSIEKVTFTLPDDFATNIELLFNTISTRSRILELGNDLDAFASKFSENPFLLSGFISQFIRSKRFSGWAPFILVVKENQKIVATAPLMIKKQLGLRFASFFPNGWFAPDFVIDDLRSETCIDYVVDYLFKTLNCQYARFYLPAESPNLETLERQCRVRGISFSTKNQSGHRVLSVDCTWQQFQEKRGRRRIVRQIEHKLNQIGSWKIEYVEDVNNRTDILQKILAVEKMSWKESWRNRMQIATDEELLMVWEGSQISTRSATDLKCSVWFLQINRETVAYTFVVKYKGTAFITKTCFDNRYRKFYVGKYLMHIVIGDIFNERQIKTIDFMTDLPFLSFWTSLSLTHVEGLMWKGHLANFVEQLRSNTFTSKVLKLVLDTDNKFLLLPKKCLLKALPITT